MSAVLDLRPARLFDPPAPGAATHTPGRGVEPFERSEQTLEDVISSAWGGLALGRAVDCPMCGAALEPVYGAAALPLGGRCGACDTRLA